MKRILLAATALIAIPAIAAAQPADNKDHHAKETRPPAHAAGGAGAADHRGAGMAADHRAAGAGMAADRRETLNRDATARRETLNRDATARRTTLNRDAADRRMTENRVAADHRMAARVDFARSGWWRGRAGFNGYAGPRRGFWFAPGRGYYAVDPRWWGYSWNVGAFVPVGLRSYYIVDPWAYGLDPAPFGFRWIFLGNRLVLINANTGVVVRVAGYY